MFCKFFVASSTDYLSFVDHLIVRDKLWCVISLGWLKLKFQGFVCFRFWNWILNIWYVDFVQWYLLCCINFMYNDSIFMKSLFCIMLLWMFLSWLALFSYGYTTFLHNLNSSFFFCFMHPFCYKWTIIKILIDKMILIINNVLYYFLCPRT